MKKELKVSYKILDLPYSATEEEVETRKNALIKILESEKNAKTENKILEIENASKTIITNMENNGIPNEEHHLFESSGESIIALSIVLVFVIIICFFSFYLFS